MSDDQKSTVINEPDLGGTDDGLIYIDPEAVSRADSSSSDGGGSQSRGRRGRPVGSRNATKADGSASLKGIEIDAILVSIHTMLAMRAGPHWALDADEAKQLDKAIKNAMRHQDMKVTQKQLDYAMLAYVVAQIYGARIVTSVMMARQKPAETRQENVTRFPLGA